MIKIRFVLIILLVLFFNNYNTYSKKIFTFEDAMKFKSLSNPKISNDGKFISYQTTPDRGDGEAIIQYADDTTKIIIPRGSNLVFSEDSRWAAATLLPKAIDLANAKSSNDTPKNGLAIVRILTNRITEIESVKNFQFTNDSKWLIYQKYEDNDVKSEKLKKKKIGSKLVIRHLVSGTEIPVDYVNEYLIDSLSNYIFYAVSSPDGKRDGIYKRRLTDEYIPEIAINNNENTFFSNLAWNYNTGNLAYVKYKLRKEGEPDNGEIFMWEEKQPEQKKIALSENNIEKGWYIPPINNLKWTDDGSKLFFGLKPLSEKDTISFEDKKFSDSTFFNIDSILFNSDDQIWHWNDNKIGSHQKKWWNDNKNRTFTSIYDIKKGKYIRLANDTINDIPYTDNSKFALGYSDIKYGKLATYDGFYTDLYLINLENGETTLIDEKLQERASISPKGSYSLFFKNKNWFIVNNELKKIDNLTERIPVPFYDVENDIPQEPSSYAIAGWFASENYVFINEQYDIYKFFTSQPGSFVNATATFGRKYKIQFRIANVDKDKKYFNDKDTLFMHGYYDDLRIRHIFLLETHIAGGINLNYKDPSEDYERKIYTIVGKAKSADKIIYRRESFEEFPDLWYSDIFIDTVKKISNVNPQIKDFIWGTTEPYQWVTQLGDTVKGYLIKPDNYNPKKKYPVLVYFYERFADQTYRFYQPRINHRPIYQTYLGTGYLVFVPDVIYKTGRPGQDAYDCIVSGLNMLIEKGVIDKDKIVIQGHSWGGYQTAYLAATTNIFRAAAAGAPVGNMTSAYSQIRTESGLARQFQYEKYQSRIGGNLWDSLANYINNSPVFQLPKGGSPLLILHGNVDEAVPFAQGVELYLAYRRLGKPCVLIEYNNEPHHPRKYENKLDWQIKMKEWFDYYVFGEPKPDWIIKGKPYFGK